MSSKKNFQVRPFEGLKKKIERTAVSPAAGPPNKKNAFTEEELFNQAMEDVQVIEAFRRLSFRHGAPARGRPPAAPYRQDSLTVLTEIAEGARPMHLPDTQEYVEWTNPDYAAVFTEQLHAGHFSVQAFLDLHGFSVLEAEEELGRFFRESLLKGLGCVKVIHGRGLRSVNGPRIKQAVTRLLSGRYRKTVIAYASARQCDGGLGALYILLAK